MRSYALVAALACTLTIACDDSDMPTAPPHATQKLSATLSPSAGTGFALDQLRVDGNIVGGFMDEFDDGSMTQPPTSEINCRQPADESGGFLILSVPFTFCALGDLSQTTRLRNGFGDATVTAGFRADRPMPNEAYRLQMFTLGAAERNEGVSIEVGNFGIGPHIFTSVIPVSGDPPVVGDPVPGQAIAISLEGLNRLFLRLRLDDATDLVQASFSLDGGQTFTDAPLPIDGRVFVGASEAVVAVTGFGPNRPPMISVDPVATIRDFGSLTKTWFTRPSAQETFTVTNIGGEVLRGVVRIAPVSPPFAVVRGGTFELAPGAQQDVVIEFAPTSKTVFESRLEFESNDPQRGLLVRAVVGEYFTKCDGLESRITSFPWWEVGPCDQVARLRDPRYFAVPRLDDETGFFVSNTELFHYVSSHAAELAALTAQVDYGTEINKFLGPDADCTLIEHESKYIGWLTTAGQISDVYRRIEDVITILDLLQGTVDATAQSLVASLVSLQFDLSLELIKATVCTGTKARLSPFNKRILMMDYRSSRLAGATPEQALEDFIATYSEQNRRDLLAGFKIKFSTVDEGLAVLQNYLEFSFTSAELAANPALRAGLGRGVARCAAQEWDQAQQGLVVRCDAQGLASTMSP